MANSPAPERIREMVRDIQRSERLIIQRSAELCEVGEATVPYIVEHLDSASDALIDVLTSMGDGAARAALPRLMEFASNPSHEGWAFAIRALIALDDIAYPDAAILLVRCIREDRPDAGRGLVHVIHKTGDEYRESICEALAHWISSPDPALRAEGARWLSELEETSVAEAHLRRLLEDPAEEVRFAAQECLTQLDLGGEELGDTDIDPMRPAPEAAQ